MKNDRRTSWCLDRDRFIRALSAAWPVTVSMAARDDGEAAVRLRVIGQAVVHVRQISDRSTGD